MGQTANNNDGIGATTGSHQGIKMNATSPGNKAVVQTSSEKNKLKETTNTYSNGGTPPNPKKTLKDRGRMTPSMVVTACSVLGIYYCCGLFHQDLLISVICPSIFSSLSTSITTVSKLIRQFESMIRELLIHTNGTNQNQSTVSEFIFAIVLIGTVLSILFVLVYSPLRAGMWTGQRASKHLVHRYMGLVFLIQYGLAWVEFVTDYDGAGRDSFLPVTIALNGMIQATSAYFSFKVLPEADDGGYISDKAVLSRNFVHENVFYQLMCLFGSIYYNDRLRTTFQSSQLGRVLEIIFVFLPYALYRPIFPTTRFKDAGSSKYGRSQKNLRYYEVFTLLVKLFYLWAKYYLGFFINFAVFLNKPTKEGWWVIRGLYLLNVGTVSIAVFLHTLRFKKVLPPLLTFSIYLAQIYATFTAVPYLLELFLSIRMVTLLCLAGILCNMTRSRTVHAVWSIAVLIILNQYKQQL